jgi:large exoprotein involved in heme utilization and adhesion
VAVATIVETGDLVKTVVASLIAGVGVTAVFSLAIWGGARFVDLNREGRMLAAGAAAALGALALAATLGAVAVGIVVMTKK